MCAKTRKGWAVSFFLKRGNLLLVNPPINGTFHSAAAVAKAVHTTHQQHHLYIMSDVGENKPGKGGKEDRLQMIMMTILLLMAIENKMGNDIRMKSRAGKCCQEKWRKRV